jgi:hypothetical protein
MPAKTEKITIVKQDVKIVPKEIVSSLGELSDIVHYECAFCAKTTGLPINQRKICEKLSGAEFYCPFCLRHNFNTKANKHILIMSFKSIAGYYYYEKYLYANNRQIWFSEIRDIMDSHERVGLQNPAFNYDPSTFLWFVDFSKVGRGKRKIKVSEVQKTTLNILACFNLMDHVPTIKMAKLFEKYREAIEKFYQQRYRPEGKRLLIPTLAGCGVWDSKKFPMDNTKMITPRHFI